MSALSIVENSIAWSTPFLRSTSTERAIISLLDGSSDRTTTLLNGSPLKTRSAYCNDSGETNAKNDRGDSIVDG